MRALIRWASQNDRVSAAYVYGSRVLGFNRPDSDLDFAVCLSDGKETALTLWICEAAAWRHELASLLPVTVHLELAQESDEKVWPALQQHGLLIFTRPS